MLVLGLMDSKPSAVAILHDGEILAAVAEERLCRMKMASGMPREAISRVLELAGVSPGDLDVVAFGQRVCPFMPEPIPWSGWFEDELPHDTFRLVEWGSTLAPIVGRIPLAWKSHHMLKRLFLRERAREVPRLLGEEYGITAPVRFYDHHHSHATSAYFTSGFERALVVTLDGGGDGLSGSVYSAGGGRLRRLGMVDSFNSLGNFYSYITMLCGFKAEKHEGKITGLAAIGRPIYADILREFVCYREPGQIRYTVPMYHRSALRLIGKRLPGDFDRADLAASVQLVLEEIGVAFIRYWLERTGLRDVAVAGGVFANVRFNQKVHELEQVDRFFVHPAMDDSGLSVGSALAAMCETDNGVPRRLSRRLPHVYLGPAYDDRRIAAALDGAGLEGQRDPRIHRSIARLLARGHVVARFHGAMEYGPRALGHRSILYQTTDPSVNDWLNENLQRTEFMPFAPATLAEHAGGCYEGLDGAEDAARFMTITFNCTARMKADSPGVVHRDGTARPQIVDSATSPDLHGIISAYRELTGLPSVINTSFNLHEEPIVCTPEDALRAFKGGRLDYLAMDDWLVENRSSPRVREAAQPDELPEQ